MQMFAIFIFNIPVMNYSIIIKELLYIDILDNLLYDRFH